MGEFAVSVNEILNSNTRRIRQLEENLRNIRNQLGSVENVLLNEKKNFDELKEKMEGLFEQMRIEMRALKSEMKNVERIARKAVSKREMKEIESFLEIFNPLKSKFVTKEEVIDLIREYMGNKYEV